MQSINLSYLNSLTYSCSWRLEKSEGVLVLLRQHDTVGQTESIRTELHRILDANSLLTRCTPNQLNRGAMIPCILLALGGNLVDGPGSSKLGLRTTSAIIFARLVLVPPTGLGIVMMADKLGVLPPDDKMFRFVLLLQHTMPTSVLAGAVASLRGCGRDAAAVLFWVHIFAVLSMAGWIVLYLHLLF